MDGKMKLSFFFLLPCSFVVVSSLFAAPLPEPWVENRLVYGVNLPHDRDGLKDDGDYFPDDWLAKVARDGMSGVWLRVKLRELTETSFTKRPEGAAARLRRLNALIAKCARHNLKVWLMGNEPIPFRQGDPLLNEHPEFGGQTFTWINWTLWCPSEPNTLRYLEESFRDLFAQVPGLGGFVNISYGEGLSTCLDGYVDAESQTATADPFNCRRCAGRPPWQLHRDAAAAIVRGMRASNPDARYISWFYQPTEYPTRLPWVADCARHVPDGCTLMYNFESGAFRRQCGSFRTGGDYWLSFPGPATPFADVANAAKESGSRLGAKIQTCNSHELATLPYIPAPGLLYRKYKAMHECGVRDVMQCWYFGGDPGLMLEAAGALSREDFSDDEESFLTRFASAKWGDDAAVMARVWREFTDAYSEYPMSNLMQYYGPFHTGVVWPLHASVVMTDLPRSWWPNEPEAGDMIGECLERHTLDEAELLAGRMADGTRAMDAAGGDVLAALAAKYAADKERLLDIGILRAFRLHCRAAHETFRFYRLRRDAISASRHGRDFARAAECVRGMRDAAKTRIAIANELLPLAEADGRIGFHAEAAKRTYTPEKLKAIVPALERTVSELDDIGAELAAGRPYPFSERERSAVTAQTGAVCWFGGGGETFTVERRADGDVVIRANCAAGRKAVALTAWDEAATLFPRRYFVPAPGTGKFVALPSGSAEASVETMSAADGGWTFELRLRAAAWNHDPVLAPRWLALLDDTYLPQRMSRYLWPTVLESPMYHLCLHWIDGSGMGRIGD